MDLVSGAPFWTVNSGLLRTYPTLDDDLDCDVVIIGGGITGALCAYYLAEADVRVVLLDKREMGWGSTAASTAILLYEIDMDLEDLIQIRGEEEAVRAYHLCLEAVNGLGLLAGELEADVGFTRRPSLYGASRRRDARKLARECELRRKHGLPCEYWDRERIESQYSFSYEGGIYTDAGAELDTYRLTQALHGECLKRGMLAFDRTEVAKIETEGEVRVTTDKGKVVRAKKVVFATGYESQSYLRQKVVNIANTFCFVTEPIEDFEGWDQRCLIWETARPYLYLRTTQDNRAMVGGGDVPFKSALARDALIPKRVGDLKRRFDGMFPGIKTEVSFCWAGTFCGTKDGLPYIGASPEWPNAYFALGFGGNGITFSWLAARMIRDAICGVESVDAGMFGFGR